MSPSRLLEAQHLRPVRKLDAVPTWPTSFATDTLPRVFHNARPQRDHNTCGQAAAATVLAHFHAGPFAATELLEDGAAIDRVCKDFPPDVPLGLGTSAHRIAAALRHFGLRTEIVHSGPFGRGVARAIERLTDHVALGIPVPVCVDDGALENRPWSAHWAVALHIEDACVVLGNVNSPVIPLDRFLTAWRCRHLPWPHHHCAILADP
jgi:hypothetical protein